MREDIDPAVFEKRLRQRLKDINAEMEQAKSHSGPVELDQARMGRVSRMDAMQQQAMSQAAQRLSKMEKNRILKALDRIKSGDYGYCVNCEEEISEKRLAFDPSVMFCIGCAKAAENK